MAVTAAVDRIARSRIRYQILLMLFAVTVLNYADRAIISVAGAPLSKEFGIDPVAMGYIFSAFSWSYVAAQIPGGWLLDRYETKRVYAIGILFWSLFTFLQGWAGFFGGGAAIVLLFVLRLAVGVAEAPSFPGNARIVAAWFPGAERGTASAIFNSAQYFAPVIFAPLTSWIVQEYGWRWAFFVMGIGALGWAVVSDTSPKEIAGLSGGLFNMFGNTAGITTPIIIGYILHATGSFNGALVFVGLNAFVAMAAYLFVVGEIRRVELER